MTSYSKLGWLLVLLAPLVAACTSRKPTEIVAGLSTQMRVPEGLKAVGLTIQAGGRLRYCETYPVVDGTATLPATFGLLGQSGFERAPDGLVTLQVLGFRTSETNFADDCFISDGPLPDANSSDPNEIVVVRRRRLSFVNDRILFLPLPIKESCNDRDCPVDGETCIGGECVAMDIDAALLPDYDDSLIFGNTNTCFDPTVCIPRSGSVPVLLVDPADCTFRAVWPASAPVPAPGELNVRMFYNTFGTEILDLDPASLDSSQYDGLSFVDPADPVVFRLAPNVCRSNYQENKILGLEASALCPTKRPYQPICDGTQGGASPDAGAGGGSNDDQRAGICTVASLSSAESAAYVLMDSSLSMGKFFGDGGLRFAVELPLQNPVARRTRLAFDLLPTAAAECDALPNANDFATPRIPFQDVGTAREPIGDLLGDVGTVLADNPPLFMEAGMEGAYRALAELEPLDSTRRFNRKALVVIANRDFGGECATDGVTPAQRALAAFTSGIYTYSVVLENEDGSDTEEAQAVADAIGIATAGGTTVFNGVADETEGAKAVQEVFNDLGSCLYDVRGPLTGDPVLPADATISYLNPLAPSRTQVDISRNSACDETNQDTVSGFNQVDEDATVDALRVRICGQACEDLRNVLNDVAVVHGAQGNVAPPVPLVVSAQCPNDSAFAE